MVSHLPVTRRHLLSAVGAAAVGTHFSGHSNAKQNMYRMVLNSPSDVRVNYEFAVTGEIVKTIDTGNIFSRDVVTKDPEDQVIKRDDYEGTIVRGVTQGGVDAYIYTGQLDTFNATNCSEFNVWVNGKDQPACVLNENYDNPVPGINGGGGNGNGNGDGGGNGGAIEFLDCTTVRVKGEFDVVMIDWTAYTPGSVSNLDDYGPITGEEVFSISDILSNGDDIEERSVIDSVSAYRNSEGAPSGTPALEQENPSRDKCAEQARPDKPSLSVENVTRTGKSAYEVTFGYTNPNEFEIFASESFETGHSPDTPPRRLKPGDHTFTVTWQPEADEEQLRWEFYPSGYRGIETVSVSTPPHAEVRNKWALSLGELRAKLDEFAPIDVEVTSVSESAWRIQLFNNRGEATLTVRDSGAISYEEETGWWDIKADRDELLRPAASAEALEPQAETSDLQNSNPSIQSFEETEDGTYTVTVAIESRGFGGRQGTLLEILLRNMAPSFAKYIVGFFPVSGIYSDILIEILKSIMTIMVRDLFTTAEATTSELPPTTTENSPTTTETSTTTESPTTTTETTTTTTDTPTTTTTTEKPDTTTTTTTETTSPTEEGDEGVQGTTTGTSLITWFLRL